jgi:hypothetical protein
MFDLYQVYTDKNIPGLDPMGKEIRTLGEKYKEEFQLMSEPQQKEELRTQSALTELGIDLETILKETKKNTTKLVLINSSKTITHI